MNDPTRYTCQICGRSIKLVCGRIAHHGYRRPYGAGFQSQSCYGARVLSYEQSRDRIPSFIDCLTDGLYGLQDRLAKVVTGTIAVPNMRGMIEPGETMYPVRRREEQVRLEHELAHQRQEILHMQARYDAWVDPECDMSKLFPTQEAVDAATRENDEKYGPPNYPPKQTS